MEDIERADPSQREALAREMRERQRGLEEFNREARRLRERRAHRRIRYARGSSQADAPEPAHHCPALCLANRVGRTRQD